MKTLNDLKNDLYERGLSSYFEKMKASAKNAIGMEYDECDDDEIPIGASKFGGLPDLPRGRKWIFNEETGVPMSFLCQIDLSSLSSYDTEGKLPEEGLLSFFYDCSEDGMKWGYSPEDIAGCRVLFTEARELPYLERKSEPIDLEKYGQTFDPARLTFESRVEIAALDTVFGKGVELPEEEGERLGRYLDEKLGELSNKLLGHADPVQGGMETECAFVANGYDCGSYVEHDAATLSAIENEARLWTLLLQLDSNDDLGMMWGDCGKLYFYVREDDLKNRDFSKVRLILQCF